MWLRRGKHSRRCNTIALLKPIADVFYLSQTNSSVISLSNSPVMVQILTPFPDYNHKRNTTGREGNPDFLGTQCCPFWLDRGLSSSVSKFKDLCCMNDVALSQCWSVTAKCILKKRIYTQHKSYFFLHFKKETCTKHHASFPNRFHNSLESYNNSPSFKIPWNWREIQEAPKPDLDLKVSPKY